MILLPAANLLAQKPTSPAPQNQTVQFNVYFPLQNSSQLDELITNLNTQGSPNYQQWLTPEEFRQQFGASPSAMAEVQSWMAEYGITLLKSTSHSLRLQGTVAAIQKSFGATRGTRPLPAESRPWSPPHP
jgi:kumamolisin